MRPILSILLITFSLLSGNTHVLAEELDHWRLRQIAKTPQEYLLYRLAYRGIFTAFTWKKLADVAFIAADSPQVFQGQTACELRMRLSTEDYTLAEVMRPTRYEWRSLAAPDLDRVYLVEVSDITTGDERERRVKWLDWPHRSIELFRLREREPITSTPFFDDDDSVITGYTWEADGSKPVPAFLLDDEPLIENRYTPLIYDKTMIIGDDAQHLIDPLAFIYAARWHDYREGDLVRPIAYKDEIRHYRAHLLDREQLTIGQAGITALKVDMQRTHLKDAKDEGFMRVWFSDDARRIPLKFIIDAKVGAMRVHIVPASFERIRPTHYCLSVAPTPTPLSAGGEESATDSYAVQ